MGDHGSTYLKRNVIAWPSRSTLDAFSVFTGLEPCVACNATGPSCESPPRGAHDVDIFVECHCGTPFPKSVLMDVAHAQLVNRSGWILYLDDDALLADSCTIGALVSYAVDPDVLYMFRAHIGHLTPTSEHFGLDYVVRGDIHASNFMFHTSHLGRAAWGTTRCGDFRTASSLAGRLPLHWPLAEVVVWGHPLRLWRQHSEAYTANPTDASMATPGTEQHWADDYVPITAVTSAYRIGARTGPLLKYLGRLVARPFDTLIAKVVMVWNGPASSPPLVPAKVQIVVTGSNSLHNRWRYALEYSATEAVLMLDDDVHVSLAGIMCLYTWWNQHPDRLVGAFARRLSYNNATRTHEYVMSELRGQKDGDGDGHYNMVLPRAMVLSKALLQHYAGMSVILKRYVDQQEAHCDDVALNAIVAEKTGQPPIWVALPARSVVDCDAWALNKNIPGYHGLATPGQNRSGLRSECTNFILPVAAPSVPAKLRMPMTMLVGECDADGIGAPQGDGLLRTWIEVGPARWQSVLVAKEDSQAECQPD